MSDELHLAQVMLKRSGVSLLEAARLIQQILDFKPTNSNLSEVPFCSKVIQSGLAHLHVQEMRISDGFKLYVKSKSELRPDSLRDIKYLGKRIMLACPELAAKNFADISVSDCENWLSAAFSTPSQFNKGRALLHALFNFAMKREWCERNVVKLVSKKKVIEQEIQALSLEESRRLIQTSQQAEFKDCAAGVGLLLWAGLRPTELKRLRWKDIDMAELSITIRAHCSKTGGVRQVEICPALQKHLKRHLSTSPSDAHLYICPSDWSKQWKRIRDEAGFQGRWVQDVLRHSYASYHAKHFKDLTRLQYNMGHRDQSLLRARYINLHGISKQAAQNYFKWVS